jgi:hypothetical protein
MPWTVETALGDAAVEQPVQFVSEFKFFLKDIPTEITIRLYRPVNGSGVQFTQSHFIQTPDQAGPYRTSRPWNDDEPRALHQVIDGLTSYYKAAVLNGHKPSADWLHENSHFG